MSENSYNVQINTFSDNIIGGTLSKIMTKWNDDWWKEEEKPVQYDKDGKVIWWEDNEEVIDKNS